MGKILGWIGIHYPTPFHHVSVTVESNGSREKIIVENPFNNKWMSDAAIINETNRRIND